MFLECHGKVNGTDGLTLYPPLRVWTVRTAWGCRVGLCVMEILFVTLFFVYICLLLIKISTFFP